MYYGPVLNHTEVRLINDTPFGFDSVLVRFAVTPISEHPESEQALTFGAIPSGGHTAYRPLEGGFTYNYTVALAYGIHDEVPWVAQHLSPMFRQDRPVRSISIGPGRYAYHLRYEPYALAVVDVEYADPGEPDAPSDQVEVRVVNRDERRFDAVHVTFPEEGGAGAHVVAYGALKPGEASGYVTVPASYRFARTEVVVGPDTARFEPIDYVGEPLLGPGQHTFGLAVERVTAYRDRTEVIHEGDR